MSRVQANCLLLLAAAFWGFGNVAQKTVLDHALPPAGHAAVIVSAESVFGAVGAAIFLGERLTPTGAVGTAVVFGSITLLSLTTNRSEISKPAVAD